MAGAAAVTVMYIQTGKQYRTVFFPNTTINGVDASKKTVDEVKQPDCFWHRWIYADHKGERRSGGSDIGR